MFSQLDSPNILFAKYIAPLGLNHQPVINTKQQNEAIRIAYKLIKWLCLVNISPARLCVSYE